MDEETLNKYLDDANISRDKPLITQVSRFDKWKDPEGVLEVYKRVKKKVDCHLVLCGSMAADDPEGYEIYNRIHEVADPYIQTGDISLVAVESGMLVNALQTCSDVIIQKSLREGFGLTVTEAMWKGTAVVASRVGGIPLQIIDGETGYLLEPTDYDGFAERIIHLLKNPEKRREMGQRAKEYVRDRYLITRLLENYLDLATALLKS